MKSFFRQVKFEIRNIIKSRFLLVIALLLLAASIAFPVINLIAAQKTSDNGGVVRPMPMGISMRGVDMPAPIPGFPGMEQDSITVDGVTIYSDNPFSGR